MAKRRIYSPVSDRLHFHRPRKPLIRWTDEQVQQMLELAVPEPADHLMIRLAEAYTLHHSDIPLIRPEHVQTAIGEILLPTGARHRLEAHAIVPALAPELEAYVGSHTGEFLFLGHDGQLWPLEARYRVWQYAWRAGFETLHERKIGNGHPTTGVCPLKGRRHGPRPDVVDPETGRPYRHRPPGGLTQAEVTRLLETAAAQSGRLAERNAMEVKIQYLYALRPGEVERLFRHHVDLVAKRIYIPREKDCVSRWYPIFPDLVDALKEYLSRRPLPTGAPEPLPTAQDVLFPSRLLDGKGQVYGMTADAVNILLQQLAEKAGLDRPEGFVRGYVLRHSIATHLLDAGWTLRDVQHHLGHKSIRSTQVYARVTDLRLSTLLAAIVHSPHIAHF